MLRSANRDAEAILEAVGRSQAIIQFQPDGTIITANENFCNAMGYALNEIQGKHHSMFAEPAYANSAEYRAFWEALRAGTFQAAEYKRLGKGGREVWIQASYNPVKGRDGKVYKVVKFATDITAAKMRSADFEGQIAAIGKSNAVIEFNLDGSIITANENFCNTMGYALNEIQGKHHSMFADPDYARSAEYKAFWEALRRGEFQASEYRRLGKGNREIWIQASYNPIFDPSGRPFKVVKFATDITDAVKRRQEAERIGKMVDASLEKIVHAVEAANQRSANAASAAAETSSTVQAVATAANQFDASTQEIARSMGQSRTAVEKAMAETEAVGQSTAALAKAADAMNGIVEIIQNIAGQINLLALNATIESARAGEAGKGFAVVATEVKNLANQVASAISQISGEISNVQTVSGEVVQRIQQIHQGVSSVQESVAVVASAIEEQSVTSQEITSNMQAAASAVGDISASLEEISSAVDSTSGYANEGIELYRSLNRDAA
ncbi:MAG: PAS domain-containing methyl-accepting chemotaxis protein [Alphaproteobacteria bacterium]